MWVHQTFPMQQLPCFLSAPNWPECVMVTGHGVDLVGTTQTPPPQKKLANVLTFFYFFYTYFTPFLFVTADLIERPQTLLKTEVAFINDATSVLLSCSTAHLAVSSGKLLIIQSFYINCLWFNTWPFKALLFFAKANSSCPVCEIIEPNTERLLKFLIIIILQCQ